MAQQPSTTKVVPGWSSTAPALLQWALEMQLSTRRTVLNDWISAHTGRGLQLAPGDVSTALFRCKRRRAMDHYGTGSALQILADVCPNVVAEMLSIASCSREEIPSFTVQGTDRAKKKGPAPNSKVRTISPMPMRLGVVDGAVAQDCSLY